MSKVKLQVVEIGPLDAYSKSDKIKAGDVIEFDSMPNFKTWDLADDHPSQGYDWTREYANGANLRTGEHRLWCFHAIKFEKA
jgi:hypothetical protein